MKTLAALALVACATVLAPLPALAQTAPSATDDERARVHFSSGRSYFEEGNYERALEEFQRAYDLSHRTVLLVNIANCQERLGMWREAADSLEAFVATIPETDEQRPTMQRRIENLRQRAAQREAELAAASQTQTQTPTTTGTEASTSTGAPPAGAPASDGLLVPSLVAFGVGGVALIAWGVLGGLALAEEGTVSAGCGATRSCTPAQVQAMDDLAAGADAMMVIGLVGVAAGAVMIAVAPPSSGSSAEQAPSARIAPFGGREGAGLVVVGSF